MYSFSSAENKALYTAAMDRVFTGEAFMHIFGTLTLADGTEIGLNRDEENIIGQPAIDSQITEDPEVFSVAEMYIGTLDITLGLDLMEYRLKGAEIALFVSVDGCPEEIPMGVWDVQTADKTHSSILHITAYDHLARLNVPVPDDGSTGIIRFGTLFGLIEELSGVTFAQTLAELRELFPDVLMDTIYPMSTQYAPTCWLEVQYMAQYMGAYAVANREGKIEFRRYGQEAVAAVTADERFSARISDGSFSVRSICYTDKFGRTYESTGGTIGSSSSNIYLPQDNVFIWDQEPDDSEGAEERVDSYYKRILDPIRREFNIVSWYTGSIDYRGDPTLDTGDMILVTGGAAGSTLKKFLICQNTWQFRGAQSLSSGGAPRVGDSVTSSGGSGGSVYSSTVINTTKNIVTVPMTVYTDMLIGVPRTAARGAFKAKESTVIFVTVTLVMLGNADSTAVKAAVYIDDDIIGVKPAVSLDEGRTATLSFAFPVTVSGGEHTVRVTAENYGEIVSAAAEVSGQSITAGALTYDETNYEYTLTADSAAVTGYSGGVNAEIPEVLGGKPVTVIASGAFSGDVETVYIPEGTEVIE